jgi:hypothetical protein
VRLAGVRMLAGETAVCMDMAIAPIGLNGTAGPQFGVDRRSGSMSSASSRLIK